MARALKSKRKCVLSIALVIVGVIVITSIAAAVWVARGIDDWRIRSVSLPRPADIADSVSEEQAMALAKSALEKTWPSVKQWTPISDKRAQGQFFIREGDSLNIGQITFDTAPRAWSVTVRLSVEQDLVRCNVVRHK